MWQPKRICSYPGCNVLCDATRCPAHTKSEQRYDRQRRGTAAERGYDARWQKYRDAYVASHPLCVECMRINITKTTEEVHHIKPIREGGERFDENNLMALCKSCHSRITGQGR